MPGRTRPTARRTEMAAGHAGAARLPGHRRAVAARACLILAGAGLVAGCGVGRAPARPPIRYVRQSAEKTYGDCAAGNDRCTRIMLRWPLIAVAPIPAAAESIGAFIRSTLLQPYDGGAPLANEDSVMAGFIEAYRAFAAGSWGGPSIPWWFERRIEALGETLGVASLAITERGFLGGAHPNSTTRFANFDVERGRLLRRSDLLREAARARLDTLGERAFRRVRRIPHQMDLNAAGFWFKDGRFRLNDNVAVTPTGLLFFFNAYEIGPYALGATEVSLPWAEVRDLVRPEGPLARNGGR